MGTDNGKQDNIKIVFIALSKKDHVGICTANVVYCNSLNMIEHVKGMFRSCLEISPHQYKDILLSPETQPKGMDYQYDNTAQSDLRLWIESFRPSR